ncbi:MAG: UDP-N-acetylmuramoyl-tripeptide--D-alanyl-D-alanine ligase [Prevotella sp.]|nr:UDP-N-acetylmuramoyl-tripeptide--D-alanyl-D-alanine ligase [Prevotella sp.]
MEIAELYKVYQACRTITTDSRNCPEGSIFIALKGASFDGNKFAADALKQGCAYAVVDNADYADDERCILVDDCLKTFQQLARFHRRQFDIPVIGITGTNGKTTTKELVSAVLGEKYNVLYTQGNFNNDIGVPKTLFRIEKEHDIAVIEMGASHPGDIKTLVELAEPGFGLITNVGCAHLQGFGSFEGVIKTKGELYDFLRNNADSEVFINGDDEVLADIAKGLKQIKYDTTGQESSEITGEVMSCAPFLKFRWKAKDTDWHEVQTHLIGAYNIYNMLAAVAVGRRFNVSEESICNALGNYIPSNNRSQLSITEHNKLIVDAYNANPTSMKAALENFQDMAVSPKMAIIGSMGELGAVSDEEHQKIANLIGKMDIEDVWLVGEGFENADTPLRKFRDVEEVRQAIKEKQPQGYYILIKGSNSQKLFQLPECL